MNFLWTTIHVKNMEVSVDFYQQVIGLTIDSRFQAGAGVEITLLKDDRIGTPILELLQNGNEKAEKINGNPVLGFEVQNYEDSVAFVREKGIKIVGEPMETPKFKWFTIVDPDGMNINLFQKKGQ